MIPVIVDVQIRVQQHDIVGFRQRVEQARHEQLVLFRVGERLVEVEADGDVIARQSSRDVGRVDRRQPLERRKLVHQPDRHLLLPEGIKQPVHVHRVQRVEAPGADVLVHDLQNLAIELRHQQMLLLGLGSRCSFFARNCSGG